MATTRKDNDATEAAPTDPLQAEVAALRADLGELATLVSRIGRHRAAGLKAAAGSAAREGYVKGEAAFDDIVGHLESFEQDLADAARRRPFASIGLAALFGFLLGVLFRR